MGIIADGSPDGQLGTIVESCIDKLIAHDVFLLQASVHEQAMTGRLASHLQDWFPDHKVDIEYNRHQLAVKTAHLLSGVKKVKPDVVVHQRGHDDANLLVVEVKVLGRGTAEDREHAHDKLAALVHGEEFRYRYGLFLELGLNQDQQGCVIEAVWYIRNV